MKQESVIFLPASGNLDIIMACIPIDGTMIILPGADF
jgi:hypothetical protein